MSIQGARKTANLTQQQAADALGVKRSTVAMWETGGNMPRAALLPRIAVAYQCSIADLFANEETEKSTGAPDGRAGALCCEEGGA